MTDQKFRHDLLKSAFSDSVLWIFLPFCIKVFVIVAGHKADTVCVEDCGMHLDRLCLQRISHDVVAVHSYVFAKPQNKLFLISPHCMSSALT